jgi:hypothetical protein
MAGIKPNTRKSSRAGPDYYPTPPWATRALCEWLGPRFDIAVHSVWEPACGEGYMARPLAEYFDQVFTSDYIDRSATYPDQGAIIDFLLPWHDPAMPAADWIVTNPPFNCATEFIALALERARVGVAMLVKVQFLEGVRRFGEIYSQCPPVAVLQFSERVPMVQGRIDPDVSSNQAYIWVIFLKDNTDTTRLHWIGPARADLERPQDYKPLAGPDVPEAMPLFEPVAP